MNLNAEHFFSGNKDATPSWARLENRCVCRLVWGRGLYACVWVDVFVMFVKVRAGASRDGPGRGAMKGVSGAGRPFLGGLERVACCDGFVGYFSTGVLMCQGGLSLGLRVAHGGESPC